jgi:hypothetical protein
VLLCEYVGMALFPLLLAALAKRPQRFLLGLLLIVIALFVLQSAPLANHRSTVNSQPPPTPVQHRRPTPAGVPLSLPHKEWEFHQEDNKDETKHNRRKNKYHHVPLPDDEDVWGRGEREKDDPFEGAPEDLSSRITIRCVLERCVLNVSVWEMVAEHRFLPAAQRGE